MECIEQIPAVFQQVLCRQYRREATKYQYKTGFEHAMGLEVKEMRFGYWPMEALKGCILEAGIEFS